MKRSQEMRVRALGVGVLVCAAVQVGGREARAADGTVSLSPPTIDVAVGQSFTLSIGGSGFTRIVDGGGVTLNFDATKLQVLAPVVVDAATWEFFTQPGTINNSTGQVTDIAFASFIGRTLTFSIATVSLRRIAAGNTQVTLTPSGQNPFGSGGQPLAVSLVGASVGPTVTNTGVGVPVGPFAGVAIAASLLATGVRALRARGRAR